MHCHGFDTSDIYTGNILRTGVHMLPESTVTRQTVTQSALHTELGLGTCGHPAPGLGCSLVYCGHNPPPHVTPIYPSVK